MVSPRWLTDSASKPTGRPVSDDLHVMIGQPRQQRTARNVVDSVDALADPAFGADRIADVRGRRAVAAGGEVEQDAVRREILDVAGLEVFDRGIVAAVEQRRPVIIGADVHAPLVGEDLRGGRRCGRFAAAAIWRLEVARMLAIAVHW